MYKIRSMDSEKVNSVSVGRISRSIYPSSLIYKEADGEDLFVGIVSQRALAAISIEIAEFCFQNYMISRWRDPEVENIISIVKKSIYGETRPSLDDFVFPKTKIYFHLNANEEVINIVRESIRIASGFAVQNTVRCLASFGISSTTAVESAYRFYNHKYGSNPKENRLRANQELERQGEFIISFLKNKALFLPSDWE